MKKIISYMSMFSVLVFTLSSCKVKEGDYIVDQTGYNMFVAWNQAYCDLQSNFIDVAFKFDYWLNNSDSLQEFLEYDVLMVGPNCWILSKNQETIYTIETNGLSLSAENTQWRVTRNKGYILSPYNNPQCFNFALIYWNTSFNSENTVMEMELIQPQEWQVRIYTNEPDNNSAPYVDLVLTMDEQSSKCFQLRSYMLTGSGRFAFANTSADVYSVSDGKNTAYLDFQIEEPLQHHGDRVGCWDGGLLKMTASIDDKENERTVSFEKIENEYRIIYHINDDPEAGTVMVRY